MFLTESGIFGSLLFFVLLFFCLFLPSSPSEDVAGSRTSIVPLSVGDDSSEKQTSKEKLSLISTQRRIARNFVATSSSRSETAATPAVAATAAPAATATSAGEAAAAAAFFARTLRARSLVEKVSRLRRCQRSSQSRPVQVGVRRIVGAESGEVGKAGEGRRGVGGWRDGRGGGRFVGMISGDGTE